MLPTENNIKSLELWLLDTFSETTFNISAEPLPQMPGKPQSFHLTENAIPYSANSPIPIPHHWKEEVKQQLDKDVKLGILCKAPLGEPTEWCMRMVTVPKSQDAPQIFN